MFQNTTISNFFSKNTKHHNNLTISELSILYKLFCKYGLKNTNFTLFCVYVNNELKIFNNITTTKLFLGLLLFFKTQNVLFVSNSTTSNQTTVFISLNLNKVKTQMDFFWKKFKNLKRPKTYETYETFFLSGAKTKLFGYSKLGFLKLLNNFFILKSNTVSLNKPTVSLNKPLLVSPNFSSSSVVKFISTKHENNFEFQYLRKNKVYNKGRYSRCRQNYRTGVYMCMYLSVVCIFGLYYWFYQFSFNFTYLWWLFISFLGSFFLPKIIKYRLYEPTTLLNKFFDFFKWSFLVLKNFFS